MNEDHAINSRSLLRLGLNFRKEITLAITLKIIALILIWALFFSHPISRKINREALASHFIRDQAGA